MKDRNSYTQSPVAACSRTRSEGSKWGPNVTEQWFIMQINGINALKVTQTHRLRRRFAVPQTRREATHPRDRRRAQICGALTFIWILQNREPGVAILLSSHVDISGGRAEPWALWSSSGDRRLWEPVGVYTRRKVRRILTFNNTTGNWAMVRAAIYKAPKGSLFHDETATYIYPYIYVYRYIDDEKKKTAAGGEIKVTHRHQFVFTTP